MSNAKKKKIRSYNTLILPVLLYWCEIWSLILREECRLRVFGNRMLRRIFDPKKDEVNGDRKELHNKELRYLFSWPSIITVNK
jgi:hypothetical protein